MNNQCFNTFIIGAQKASTSSLHFTLMQHPEIATLRDEFPIFEYDFKKDEMKRLLNNHTRLRENPKIILLKRPALLYSINSIKKIYDHNTKSKFICVLRDPAERAVSNALHYMKMGRIYFNSIDEIIRKSITGDGDILQIAFAYGVCMGKLRTMAKTFPRESFLFLKNEDMREPESHIPCRKIFKYFPK